MEKKEVIEKLIAHYRKSIENEERRIEMSYHPHEIPPIRSLQLILRWTEEIESLQSKLTRLK